MSHKKLSVFIFALLAMAAIPFVSFAQAQGGQQPPTDGQGRGGGRGRGPADEKGGGRGDGRGNGSGQRGAAAPAPISIKQVKDGVYMVINGGGNSTVRVTDQGVIVVDTKNLGDMFYNDLMAQIKTVSQQPVKYVFITHVHQDHAGNIGKF